MTQAELLAENARLKALLLDTANESAELVEALRDYMSVLPQTLAASFEAGLKKQKHQTTPEYLAAMEKLCLSLANVAFTISRIGKEEPSVLQ